MIFLLLAVITSTIIIVLFKLFEKYDINTHQALTSNYFSAVLFGYFSTNETLSFDIVMKKPWIVLSFISGILLIITFFIYAHSVRKAGMAVTSVAGKMSVVIPVWSGFLLFNEKANWSRICGIIIALLAFYLTLKPSKNNDHINLKFWYLPLLLFLGNGLNDTLLNIAQRQYINNDFTEFLTFCFFISLSIGVVVLLVQFFSQKLTFSLKSILTGLVLGIFNWFSTYFFLKGLSLYDVSVFVPIFNVLIVSVTSLIGFFIFNEKLSKLNVTGIVLAVLAILLITHLG